MENFDCVVVGAGPAGCAAAAAFRQSCPDGRIVVLDRSRFPRDKTCGDGIAHEVGTELARLGFDVQSVFAGTTETTDLALRSPGDVTVRRPMALPVRVVPRMLFDSRLVQDVRDRGIEVRRHVVRRLSRTSRGVELDGALHARVVIAADGAESRIRSMVSTPSPAGTVALAIRAYAPELASHAGAQLITMDRSAWPAYAWSFPIGDGSANVGYGQLLGRTPLTREVMLARLQALLPGVDPDPATVRAHRLPLSTGRPAIAAGPVLLVGDAQSLINPLTGEGIFYAVVSGGMAGTAAATTVGSGQDAGAVYRGLMKSRLTRHLRHTSAATRLTRHPRLIDAGVRAARADHRSFDDLVRFGLADGLLTPRLCARLALQLR